VLHFVQYLTMHVQKLRSVPYSTTEVGVGVNPTFWVFTAQNMVGTLQIKDQKEFL